MSGRIIYNSSLNWDTGLEFELWVDTDGSYVMKFDKYAKIVNGEVEISSEVMGKIEEKHRSNSNLNYIMIINEKYAYMEFPNVENFFDKINYLLETVEGEYEGLLDSVDQIYSIAEYLIKEIVE